MSTKYLANIEFGLCHNPSAKLNLLVSRTNHQGLRLNREKVKTLTGWYMSSRTWTPLSFTRQWYVALFHKLISVDHKILTLQLPKSH